MTFRQLLRRISKRKTESDGKTRISKKKNASPSSPNDERLQRNPRRRPISSLIRFLRKKSKTQNKASAEIWRLEIYNFHSIFCIILHIHYCRLAVLKIHLRQLNLLVLHHQFYQPVRKIAVINLSVAKPKTLTETQLTQCHAYVES